MAMADSTAPSRSNGVRCSSRLFGTAKVDTANERTLRPMGRAKTHGQVALSTTQEEKNRPRIPPAPANPDQMPTARARCSGGKLEVITERVTGMIIAAPTPATTRATSSDPEVVDRAAARLARVNTTRPAMRMGLRPQRSPMAPMGMSSAERARVYPLMIHSRVDCEAPSSRARSCCATFRPETEATTATRATHMASRMRRNRRRSVTTAGADSVSTVGSMVTADGWSPSASGSASGLVVMCNSTGRGPRGGGHGG